jgi:hypothetical protein
MVICAKKAGSLAKNSQLSVFRKTTGFKKKKGRNSSQGTILWVIAVQNGHSWLR